MNTVKAKLNDIKLNIYPEPYINVGNSINASNSGTDSGSSKSWHWS